MAVKRIDNRVMLMLCFYSVRWLTPLAAYACFGIGLVVEHELGGEVCRSAAPVTPGYGGFDRFLMNAVRRKGNWVGGRRGKRKIS